MSADRAYAALADLWLEIPALGVKMSIVGVPVSNGSWDVSWLWNQAGWLQGTAFPTTAGNSVITGHVYLSDGKPGPFVSLRTLPSDSSVFRHEQLPWVTLVTCQGYNASDNSYRYRTVVRTVLISVSSDTP
jgi:sortase (surface protein transpeptidase)